VAYDVRLEDFSGAWDVYGVMLMETRDGVSVGADGRRTGGETGEV
jgi:hypothetical protein